MNGYTISFTGAGRVGSSLCAALYSAGFPIGMIVSVNEAKGRKLAGSFNAEWSPELRFPAGTDLIIVAVPDHNLQEILGRLECHHETLVTHTAGSYGMEVFPDRIRRKGVLYPLQTFSPGRIISFTGLPFFIEASDEKARDLLKHVVQSTGGLLYEADTEKRRLLHLAAVFVCNFTNHLLTCGKEIALQAGFPFEILKPLISETISKALDQGPENSQTGPAYRNDRNTIDRHLGLIPSGELRVIYENITNSIIKHYQRTDG